MTSPETKSPAELYEEYLVPGIHARFVPRLLEHADPAPGERVLDVACGTGIVARHLAPRLGPDGRIVAQDVDPGMLRVARALPAPEGAPIEWLEGDAASPPDGPFDLVTCQQGLQFFERKAEAARAMYEALVAGTGSARSGRAVVSVFRSLDRHPLYEALLAAEADYLDQPVDAVAAPFSYGDAGRLEDLFDDAGFRKVEVTEESFQVRFPSPDRFVALTLAAAASLVPGADPGDAEAREEMIATVGREVEPILAAYVEGDTVAFAMHTNVAVASV